MINMQTTDIQTFSRVFHKLYENVNIAIFDFTARNTRKTPVGIEPRLLIASDTKFNTFLSKIETLDSL